MPKIGADSISCDWELSLSLSKKERGEKWLERSSVSLIAEGLNRQASNLLKNSRLCLVDQGHHPIKKN